MAISAETESRYQRFQKSRASYYDAVDAYSVERAEVRKLDGLAKQYRREGRDAELNVTLAAVEEFLEAHPAPPLPIA